jgi:hypothetical protein
VPKYSGRGVWVVGGNYRRGNNSKVYVRRACLYNVILIGGYTVNKETEEAEEEQKKRNREADLLLLELLEGIMPLNVIEALYNEKLQVQ